MELIRLNNNRTIPVQGFGTFQITDEKICEESVMAALNAGYRLIDTAACYGNERAVGRAIAKSNIPRNKIYISSKVWIQDAGYEKTKICCMDTGRSDILEIRSLEEVYRLYNIRFEQ